VVPSRPLLRPRRGVSISEMLVYMTIAGLVMVAMYSVMMRQGRGYTRQLAAVDADESARDAAALLAWDIRHSAMAGDQLVSFASDEIALLSVQGVGVVCSIHSSLPRYGIWKTGGSMEHTTNDSAMVYRLSTSLWTPAVGITNVSPGASLGVGNCVWPGGRAPDLTIEVAGDVTGIAIGSPVRAFRRITYKAITDGGRTWLGRKIGTGSYEKMTGPLKSTAGLEFAYYTSTGATTTDPAAVSFVKFTVRTESYKKYRDATGEGAYRYDSVTTAISLRR
jgi:hypothetical protein